MQIKNLEGLTDHEIQRELDNGAKFVLFTYCISIVFMTFKRSSSIYFIKSGESAFKYHWGHTGLSLIMGWWGIPWGPIYTIQSLFTNLTGGKDVTYDVLNALSQTPQSDSEYKN